jgi:hypothetical protein
MHDNYCFAGQPAPCPGYFANDILPCVCGSEEHLLFALSQVAIPAVPMQNVTATVHILPLTA